MTRVEEKQAELVEHLSELRSRLIRCVIYLIVGTVAAWALYDHGLYAFLTAPMNGVLLKKSAKFLLTGIPEGFIIQMQVCIAAGLAIVSPLVMMEMWGFVSPGLTREEKRPLRWIAPLSSLLFLAGAGLCYAILPAAYNWFALYVPANAEFMPRLTDSIRFTVQMMLAFGIVFQLPIVLMLLAKLGIVNSSMLKKNWRIAVVAISIGAAVATPSNDAFSMLMMAFPVTMLYFLSIFLVSRVQRSREG